MYDPLAQQLGSAAITVQVLEWLKKADWFPWINQHSEGVNRAVGLLTAFATSAGITFSMVGNWEAGGTITIVVPKMQVIAEAACRFALQYAAQRAIYKHAVTQPPPPTLNAGEAPAAKV